MSGEILLFLIFVYYLSIPLRVKIRTEQNISQVKLKTVTYIFQSAVNVVLYNTWLRIDETWVVNLSLDGLNNSV